MDVGQSVRTDCTNNKKNTGKLGRRHQKNLDEIGANDKEKLAASSVWKFNGKFES